MDQEGENDMTVHIICADVLTRLARAAITRLKALRSDINEMDAVRRGMSAVIPARLWSEDAWCEYHDAV